MICKICFRCILLLFAILFDWYFNGHCVLIWTFFFKQNLIAVCISKIYHSLVNPSRFQISSIFSYKMNFQLIPKRGRVHNQPYLNCWLLQMIFFLVVCQENSISSIFQHWASTLFMKWNGQIFIKWIFICNLFFVIQFSWHISRFEKFAMPLSVKKGGRTTIKCSHFFVWTRKLNLRYSNKFYLISYLFARK